MYPASHLVLLRRRFAVPALAAAAITGFGLPRTLGQAPTPPPGIEAAAQQAERQQREQQDRRREDLRRATEAARPPTMIETPVTPKPQVNARAAMRRRIDKVMIQGATRMPAAQRTKLSEAFSGRDVGVEELQQLLTEITKFYIERGYVTTRAYVPDQDLSKGVLLILVVEGRVAQLQGIKFGNLIPTRVGDILNLRNLEQGIDNLNRLQTHQATMDLAPGAKPGETDVVFRDQRSKPWHASISADNTGSEGTGKDQISATVVGEDLIGFGESVSLTHRRSLDYHAGSQASQSTSATLMLPWGYELFTAGGSDSSYALTTISSAGSAFHITGTNRSFFLRTDRVLYRGQTARLGAYANLTWKASRSFFNGVAIDVSARDSAILDLGVNYSRPLAGGFATLDGSISKGLSVLGATPGGHGLNVPEAEFTAFKLNASWSRTFNVHGVGLTYSSSLSSQWTNDVLYGSDQLTVGGIYAVRGFDRTNLAGDSGYVWRNDLSAMFRVPLFGPNHILAVKPYAGFDQGHAWTNLSAVPGFTPETGSLLGATGGLTLMYRQYNADLSYSESLARADAMAQEPGHFYFRVNASF